MKKKLYNFLRITSDAMKELKAIKKETGLPLIVIINKMVAEWRKK